MAKNKIKDKPRTRVLIALADKAHRRQIKSMLGPERYLLSWADDAQTVQKRLARPGSQVILLDVSTCASEKRDAGHKILKSAGDVPVIILPQGDEGASAALQAFGVSHRSLPWDIFKSTDLQAMIALVIQSRRDQQNYHESEQQFALKKSHDELELNIYQRTLQLRNEIEERKNIQAELELSEQRARDMAEAASDWFWETDAAGRFIYFSDTHQKILGVKSSDIIGKTRAMLSVPDDDADKWRQHEKVIEARKSFRDFQYDHVRPDGQAQTIKVSGKPVFDRQGKFTGYRGAGANITRQIATERREAKLRGQLTDAIESISDALILFGADDKFVMCNSRHRQIFHKIAHLFVPGTPFKKIVQAFVRNDVMVGIRDNPKKWVKDRLAERKNLDQKRSLREQQLHDGTWVRFNDYKTSDGGRLLLLTDVTNLRQTEEALLGAKNQAEIASRAKSDFLAGMSHELRTPLNAIIGFSDVMISGIYGHISQEKYIEYIADINRSGIHLLGLINDILDISKIESGTVKLNESTVIIHKAVEICLRLVQNKLRQGGIKLEKRIPKTLPDIFADERRINQILLNLMSNAIKFTPNGGRIIISATVRASGVLVLSISDTGIGISASQMENVMSEFGQVDNALARKTEGTGLGLPLSRGLMDIHDGTLKISSQPGKGTKVQAIFPKYRVIGCAETE